MQKIWNVLSFRQRLLLPIALMILSALASGAVALLIFSPDQFEYENEQESGSARAVARALNGALTASLNPEQTLDAFGKGLGNSEAIRYFQREHMSRCHLCAGRIAACPPGSSPISPFPTSKRATPSTS
ncbi:hypothetical protein [Bradyrhizobium sp. Leo121]|uniref:hypothetical protein n=1 Tax=Bradyrhizobium sp. Leo121 TaxID=1571195 RepID=UPI00102A0E4C|nr:hypothetical protein [Bradyrhizobium sp. Leo121]